MENWQTKNKQIKAFLGNLHDNPECGTANSWPQISIITPSFNQASFLERTILSVLNQGYPNLQYIIIDGGSSDDSVAIIIKYAHYLTYWHSKPDKGQSDAIAIGFARATGDILAWLNSDDIYLPDTLAKIGKYFSRRPDVDVVYGDYLNIDADDQVLRESCAVPFNRWGLITNAFNLHQASVFWRRDFYLNTKGINRNDEYTMDRDLWLEFLQSKARFAYISGFLSCFRLHDGSKTAKHGNKMRLQYADNINRRFGLRVSNPKYKILKKIMRMRTFLYYLFTGKVDSLYRNFVSSHYLKKPIKNRIAM